MLSICHYGLDCEGLIHLIGIKPEDSVARQNHLQDFGKDSEAFIKGKTSGVGDNMEDFICGLHVYVSPPPVVEHMRLLLND